VMCHRGAALEQGGGFLVGDRKEVRPANFRNSSDIKRNAMKLEAVIAEWMEGHEREPPLASQRFSRTAESTACRSLPIKSQRFRLVRYPRPVRSAFDRRLATATTRQPATRRCGLAMWQR